MKSKIMKKNSWFQPGSDDDERENQPSGRMKGMRMMRDQKVKAESVIFVQSTRGGVLTRRLREREVELAKLTGFGIKFQEGGGTQMVRLFNTNLSGGLHCGRKPCPPCDSGEEGKKGDCKAQNLVYESVCTICNPSIRQEDMKAGRSGVYIGETSRTIHERALEHLKDASSFSQKSHQVKHWMNSHQEENIQPAFRIRTVQKYRDCLSRQIGEALRIYYSKDQLLNSKNEYVQNCISRVVANEESWEKKERERREEEEDEKEKLKLEKFREEKSQVETSSLQEEKNPDPGIEENVTVLGGWIKKRREVLQLDGREIHKKARIQDPVHQNERIDANEESIPEGGKTLDGGRMETNTEVASKGGPGHHIGGGAPLQQINTRACVLTDSSLPEGWKAPEGDIAKKRKSSQQGGRHHRPKEYERLRQQAPGPKQRSKPKPGATMNLAWVSYWWRRMEREAQKDNEDRMRMKDGERLLGYFAKVSGLENTRKSRSAIVSESDDVAIGRHPVTDELSERPPTTDVQQGQGSHLRVSKRYIPGETFSPSKRRRDFGSNTDKYKYEMENPAINTEAGINIKGADNINIKSEIIQTKPSSNEFECGYKAMEGDESCYDDQYKSGGGVT